MGENMNQITKTNGGELVERVVVQGDLSKLSPAERTTYYKRVCESLGLNPLTKPFEYITLNGKLTLYARKDATEQLRALRGISLKIISREKVEDVYLVTAQATDRQGRTDESIGAVSIGGLKGDALANAIMKAETKAKRRVTLSVSGLGLTDETELETIPDARPQRGNPLRQDYATWGHEIDAAKSKEQVALILGSPEFAEFEKACEAQEARGGMNFAGAIRDQADARLPKLPERIEITERQENAIEEYKNAAQSSAVVAPAAPTVLIRPQEPSQPPDIPPMLDRREPEFSAIATKCMEQFDIVDDTDGFKTAQKFALEHQAELTAAEKKALNELSRRVGARLREAA